MFPVVDISVAVNKKDIVYYIEDYWIYLLLGIVFTIPVFTSFYNKHKDNVCVVIAIFIMFWIGIIFSCCRLSIVSLSHKYDYQCYDCCDNHNHTQNNNEQN